MQVCSFPDDSFKISAVQLGWPILVGDLRILRLFFVIELQDFRNHIQP